MTRLLGIVKKIAESIHKHKSFRRIDSKKANPKLTSSPINLNSSAPSIAQMRWKALCFDWSTCSLFLPNSPGPDLVRTHRTERQLKIMTIIETPQMQSKGIAATLGRYSFVTPIHAKHTNQTHKMLIFLILTPPVSLKCMYAMG